MTSSVFNKDFEEFARARGFTKKSSGEFLSVLKEYCRANISVWNDVVITGIVTLKTKVTTTTLKEWRFKKVKAFPAKALTSLIKIKC